MTSRQPKHRVIFETLRRQIAEGKFMHARRLPSEMEVAHRHGVSRPTAARALRDLQNLGLLERRAGSGTFLRKSGVTATNGQAEKVSLGLLVPGLGSTEILDPICNEITQCAQAHQSTVLWGDGSASGTTADDALRLCHHYIRSKVAGVFFAPLELPPDRQAINLQIVRELTHAGIAIVLLDRDVTEFPSRSNLDLVGIDNFIAGFVLADHLIKLGNKRFLFFARPHPPSTTDLRIAGCREAMARARISPHKRWVEFGEPGDMKLIRKLLDEISPDAILCSNDRTAAQMIQSLTQLGVVLPRDLRVVGFDDVRYASLLAVPLTTMRQPCREIAQAAVNAMFERIKTPGLHPRQILLSAELIVRQSCGMPAFGS